MLRWLWKIIVGKGCEHKWEVLSQREIFEEGHRLPFATKYYLQCEKCGWIKIKQG